MNDSSIPDDSSPGNLEDDSDPDPGPECFDDVLLFPTDILKKSLRGASDLSDALARFDRTQPHHFDLAGSCLDDPSLFLLASSLTPSTQSLSLSAAHFPREAPASLSGSLQALFDAIARSSQHFVLDLSEIRVPDVPGLLPCIARLLAAEASPLAELNLRGCGLKEEHLGALRESLAGNSALQRLVLQGNPLSSASMDALLGEMADNGSLQSLNVSYIAAPLQHGPIVELLQRNTALTSLCLGCPIHPGFVEAYAANYTLHTLRFQGTFVDPEAVSVPPLLQRIETIGQRNWRNARRKKMSLYELLLDAFMVNIFYFNEEKC